MPQNRRRFLLAWLLALYATMSLCGPGHHALMDVVGWFKTAEQFEHACHESAEPTWEAAEECATCQHGLLASDLPESGPPAHVHTVDPVVVRTASPAPSPRLPSVAAPRAPPRLAFA